MKFLNKWLSSRGNEKSWYEIESHDASRVKTAAVFCHREVLQFVLFSGFLSFNLAILDMVEFIEVCVNRLTVALRACLIVMLCE